MAGVCPKLEPSKLSSANGGSAFEQDDFVVGEIDRGRLIEIDPKRKREWSREDYSVQELEEKYASARARLRAGHQDLTEQEWLWAVDDDVDIVEAAWARKQARKQVRINKRHHNEGLTSFRELSKDDGGACAQCKRLKQRVSLSATPSHVDSLLIQMPV